MKAPCDNSPNDSQNGNSCSHEDSIPLARQHHRDVLSDCGSPRTVIRGESFTQGSFSSPIAISTDWADFTFPLEHSRFVINQFYRSLLEIVGMEFTPLASRGKGLHGWQESYSLGESSGLFAIGGQKGRALLSLPGTACTKIRNEAWPSIIELIRDEYQGRITRWDGAADDFDGIHSIEWAVEQYTNGGFKSGGNRPRTATHGDWIENVGRGRTLDVGSRKNGKLVRIYEKGNQLGDPKSPWVRWELELHRKDRDIPWDVLLNPGSYIAGAYPCMGWIHGETSRIRTFKNKAVIGYNFLTHCASQAYGKHLGVMLAIEKDPAKVLEKLIRPGKPARLDFPAPPECIDKHQSRDKP